MSVSNGDVYMHPIQRPTGPYKPTQQYPTTYQDMKAMEASSHEEDAPEHRVRQPVSKLEVLKSLDPEKAKTTDKRE